MKFPMRRSIALGIDLPVGAYTLTGLKRTHGREGPGALVSVRRGGPRGTVVGEIADRGDGAGPWPFVMRTETLFFDWLAEVPYIYNLDAAADDPHRSDEWGATTLLVEVQILADLKKVAKKGTPFVDGKPPHEWTGSYIRAPFPMGKDGGQRDAGSALREHFPTAAVWIWSEVAGWVEVP